MVRSCLLSNHECRRIMARHGVYYASGVNSATVLRVVSTRSNRFIQTVGGQIVPPVRPSFNCACGWFNIFGPPFATRSRDMPRRKHGLNKYQSSCLMLRQFGLRLHRLRILPVQYTACRDNAKTRTLKCGLYSRKASQVSSPLRSCVSAFT